MRGHSLVVMRHAKAGELPGGPDFERALRPRGQRDSAAAGRWLAARGLIPGLVLCSAARRTRQTWQHVSATLLADSAVPTPEFVAEPRLYDADSEDVAEIVGETSDRVATVLYIGHNPAAAELVALLTGTEPAFPTAAIAVIRVPSSWSDMTAGSGELIASWTPHDAAGSANAP
ncbi:MAG TPA: histidine phosphatase family protein [Streptosporangiaceae bacterium]|nr:histidine phosphatase family protein [Streptosporangiaceae bacterium]